jgi:hypothetical protein
MTDRLDFGFSAFSTLARMRERKQLAGRFVGAACGGGEGVFGGDECALSSLSGLFMLWRLVSHRSNGRLLSNVPGGTKTTTSRWRRALTSRIGISIPSRSGSAGASPFRLGFFDRTLILQLLLPA